MKAYRKYLLIGVIIETALFIPSLLYLNGEGHAAIGAFAGLQMPSVFLGLALNTILQEHFEYGTANVITMLSVTYLGQSLFWSLLVSLFYRLRKPSSQMPKEQ